MHEPWRLALQAGSQRRVPQSGPPQGWLQEQVAVICGGETFLVAVLPSPPGTAGAEEGEAHDAGLDGDLLGEAGAAHAGVALDDEDAAAAPAQRAPGTSGVKGTLTELP